MGDLSHSSPILLTNTHKQLHVTLYRILSEFGRMLRSDKQSSPKFREILQIESICEQALNLEYFRLYYCSMNNLSV